MAAIKKVGLSMLSSGQNKLQDGSDSQPAADIIFVHGLRGHPQKTWEGQLPSKEPEEEQKPKRRGLFSIFGKQKEGENTSGDPATSDAASGAVQRVFWPSALLSQDITNARIFTYGYNADVVAGLFQASNKNNIFEHTTTMVARLKRELESHDSPIIFVVHSLGGVIVKDAINLSEFLRERTKLVVFFGTPHRGSAQAGWGELAGNFARYLMFLDTNAGIVGDLDLNSQTLDRIHCAFIEHVLKNQIRVHSFQESRVYVALRAKVVENFSSRLDVGDLETVESIDADHRDMTKFCRKTDEGYDAVKGVLKSFIHNNLRGAAGATALPVLDPQAPQTPLLPAPHYAPYPGGLGGERKKRQAMDESETDDDKNKLDSKEKCQVQLFSSDYPTARLGVAERYPGTCEWILNHSDFITWNTSEGPSSPLWISGQPGMGKTVMSKFLLDRFERATPVHKTVYFFFSNEDENRQSAISFLKAAIHQFIQFSPRLFKRHVRARLAAFGDGLYVSFGLLWDIFLDMAQDPGLGPVFCVLDALDECDTKSRQDLISCIGRNFSPPQDPNQASKMSKDFKFVITSRPYEDILANWSRFHIIHLRAELEDPLVNKDIGLFVKSEVARLATLRSYSEDLKQRVQEALTDGADGMFLWAVLMVKVLESTPIAHVSERLTRLPNGIDALYDRVLVEIPEDSLDTVSTILKWAVFAFRPLTVEELGIACAIDGAPFKSLESIPLEIRDGIGGDLALCGTILKIKGNTVHLVHQTTKEYLIRRSTMDSKVERLLPPPHQAHARMSLTCLAFLDFEELDQRIRESKQYQMLAKDLRTQLPFFDYAASYWGSHLRESGPISEGTDLWEKLWVVLESTPKLSLLNITTSKSRLSGISDFEQSMQDPTSGCTPLHLLLDCDCDLASELYARTGRYTASDQDGYGRMLLHMAAERGFARVVEALLSKNKKGAKLSQTLKFERSGGGRSSRCHTRRRTCTPLHLAAAEGHEGVLRLLLQEGADPDAEDGITEYYEVNSFGGTSVSRARTALHLATAGNHVSTVRRLLDGKAQIDAMETRTDSHSRMYGSSAHLHEEWTALHIAASLGYTAIVRLLLERGARTVTEENGGTTAPYELEVEGSEFTRQHYGMVSRWKQGKVHI